METRQYIRNETVVLRHVAGESLLIPVKGHLADLQNLFVLEGLGEMIWERLDGHRSLDGIAAEFATRYRRPHEEVAADCCEFVEALEKEGLVFLKAC